MKTEKELYFKLLNAAKSNKWGIIKEMADAELNLMECSNQAVKAAIKSKHVSSVVTLLQFIEPNYGNPLSWAVRIGNAEIVGCFLTKGALTDSVTESDLMRCLLNGGEYKKIKTMLRQYEISQNN